jgi:hypothetical protein
LKLLGVFYDPTAPALAPPAEPGANAVAGANAEAGAVGVAAVPEPGSVALLVTGLGGILLAQRVRRKSR